MKLIGIIAKLATVVGLGYIVFKNFFSEDVGTQSETFTNECYTFEEDDYES